MRSRSFRDVLVLPFLAAALVMGVAALPSLAHADEVEGEPAEVAEGGGDGVISEKLDKVIEKLEVIADKEPCEVPESQGAGIDAQVVSDFFYVECAVCVLLALDLGALCWLCFRVR